MYIKRHIEKSINNCIGNLPIITLYGARQVGKTTTLNHLFKAEFNHVSLDDTEARILAQSNPKIFLENYHFPVIIDEIQKAPNLLDEIKLIVDKDRLVNLDKKPDLMYVISGSNRFSLQSKVVESLAGRTSIIEMYSLCQSEKLNYENILFKPDEIFINKKRNEKRKYIKRSDIFEMIFEGGMPGLFNLKLDRDVFFKSYVSTYLKEDILRTIPANCEIDFIKLLSYLALRTGQEIHYDTLSKEIGIDYKTLKRWISLLIDSGIIYLLHPYMANISSRVIKAPKIYFMDTGLCCYLAKIPSAKILEQSAFAGPFFETYVVSEIVKNISSNYLDTSDYLYYYRDIDQKEIDLLYCDSNDIYPIEIKSGLLQTKENKNFNVLKKYNKNIKRGLVIECCEEILPINEYAIKFPVYLL